MKRTNILPIMIIVAGSFSFSTITQANFNGNMSRVVGASGSGHTVIDECGGGTENWNAATATIKNVQHGGTSKVKIKIKNAIPNTLFTVWLRMKGQSHGTTFGGSPITGGGATPLAPSTSLDTLIADWIGVGSATQPNGFTTNHQGKGTLIVNLDFPLEGGAYPFNNMSAATLASAQAQNPTALATPTAIVDPRQANIGPGGTPFLIRMVSHCQDGLGHGVSPGNREAWFQYP